MSTLCDFILTCKLNQKTLKLNTYDKTYNTIITVHNDDASGIVDSVVAYFYNGTLPSCMYMKTIKCFILSTDTYLIVSVLCLY